MHHGALVALDETSRLLASCGHRRIRLRLHTPLAALDAGLRQLGGHLEEEGRLLELPLSTDQPAGPLLKKLLAEGLQIEDVETRQPDLEDVFLQLTGKPRQPVGTRA
jgi:ABC-2 type transport system ATP-binding protein